jgi:rfaE bifunctional protein kinase chain/domain
MFEISEIIRNQFPGKKIVIVGDLVADQFLSGTISRVSREAPVFILRHDETETLAGGAANAASNVASLGGKAVLVGLTGEDRNAENLFKVLDSCLVDSQFVIRTKEFQTTTKVRVLAGQQYAPRQQVIRIDYENPNLIGSEVIANLKSNLVAASEDSDAIIVSDYNYGVASGEIYEAARKIANEKKIPLVVDSRFRLKNFPGATSATPNKEEVEQLLGNELTVNSCVELCRKLNYRSLLVTLGNKGMLLVESGKEPVKFDCVGSHEPIDVTGAGDTVIAAYTLGLASGLGFTESAEIANHAGGIVVMKKGTASVALKELLRSVEENH